VHKIKNNIKLKFNKKLGNKRIKLGNNKKRMGNKN